MSVLLGSDRLLDSGLLAGQRIGVVSNPASVDHHLRHTADRVAGRTDVALGALFGPQHGFNADVQDNMIETGHGEDRRLRVPVYSLYSETREPTAEMLQGLDLLVIDYLQLLQGSTKRSAENRVQEITEITTKLKALAIP